MNKHFYIKILKKREKNNLLQTIFLLKKNYLKENMNIKNLKILNNYHDDYFKRLEKMILYKIQNYKWENLNNIINILQLSISQNIKEKLKNLKNKKIIQENIQKSINQINIWKILETKFKQKYLKFKLIKTNSSNDNIINLMYLKRYL